MLFTENEISEIIASLKQGHTDHVRNVASKMLASDLGKEFYPGTLVLADNGFSIRAMNSFVHDGQIYGQYQMVNFDDFGNIVD